MRIAPFAVEQWMNDHETAARWNTAETCVDSLRVDELLSLGGDVDELVRRLLATRLTYGHIVGSPELRAAVASLYGDGVSGDRVVITNGAIAANFLTLFTLVEPGDTVICVQPTYQQLYSVPAALGARVVPLPLRAANGYLPDVEELRALVDDRTRLIIVNNPNNPSGALIDAPLLGDIVAVARECGAWLLGDEVYRHLEHQAGTTPPSVVDIYERGVSTGSMSKTFSLAGLRTGWVVGPDDFVARCLEVRDYTTISVGMIDDLLATVALEHRGAILARSLNLVRGNFALVDAWIEGEPRLHYVRPRAGTTALIHYDFEVPSTTLCQEMFEHNGAFVMPGSAFGEEHCFRLGYACARDVLVGGLAAISGYLRTIEPPAADTP